MAPKSLCYHNSMYDKIKSFYYFDTEKRKTSFEDKIDVITFRGPN